MKQIMRFKELFWVAGLVLLGIVFRSISDDSERSLKGVITLSVIASIFFLYKFATDANKAARDTKPAKPWRIVGTGLVAWLWKSIGEAFWILVLVFSGELIRAWFIPLPEGLVWTWKSYFTEPGVIFLLTLVIVALKATLVVRRALKA